MEIPGHTKPTVFRRHRRKIVALTLLAALAAIAWTFTERYLLDTERYRRLIIETLAHRTRIEADIARINLDLLPSPRAIAYHAHAATPEAQATIDRIVARFDLFRLLRRELAISSIDLEGLDLRLPGRPDELPKLLDRIQQTWMETKPPPSGPTIHVALDRIQAHAALLHTPDNPKEFATLDIELRNVLTDRIQVRLQATMPGVGERARLTGDVFVIHDHAANRWHIEGTTQLTQAELARLPIPNAPAATVDATIQFTPAPAATAAAFTASLVSTDHPALSGELNADLLWDSNALLLKQAHWNAAGGQIHATGKFTSANDWHAHIHHLRMTEGTLDALLAIPQHPRVRLEADKGAYLEARDLEIGPGPDARLNIASGAAEFTALAVVPKAESAASRAAHGIRGSLSITNNIITIAHLRADAINLHGTVTPLLDSHAVQVDLTGSADLARLPWDALDALAAIHRLEGEIQLTQLAGTFSDTPGLPDDFALEATLRGGALVYADDVVQLDLRNLEGQLASDGGRITTQIEGATSSDAWFELLGAYEVETRVWTGTLRADAAEVGPPIFTDTTLREGLRPLAQAIGPAVIDVRIAMPTEASRETRIEAVRVDALPLTVHTVLNEDGTLLSVTGEGALPAPPLVTEYLPRLQGSGDLGFTIDYRPGDHQFTVSLDWTRCAIQSDTVLRKTAGTPLTTTLTAQTDPTFRIQSLEANTDGVPIITTTSPPQHGVIQLEVDMSLLAQLLVEGAEAGGTLFARYDTNAHATELNFDRVSIAIAERFALDRIHGVLQIFQDSIATGGLELHGARSDCTLRLAKIGDAWTGGLQGRSINLNAIQELFNAARALVPQPDNTPQPGQSLWTNPWIGEFTVDLGTVHYNRGHLDQLKFRLLGEDRALRIRDITAKPYTGDLSGTIAIVPAADADARLKLTLNATELDARTLNDLIWPEDKGFFGNLTGTLTFDAPLAGLNSMMATADGSLALKGLNGSLGQTGFATKLLTALNTADILNLRLPSLRDRGVVFQTWDLDLRMTAGTIAIQKFHLDGGGYAMIGRGTVSFAQDKTDAMIHVQPLESVSKVMRRVPILGDIAAAVSTDLLGIPVRFSGSPYDMQAGVAMELAKNLLTTPLRAGQGVIRSVTGDEQPAPSPPTETKTKQPDAPQDPDSP